MVRKARTHPLFIISSVVRSTPPGRLLGKQPTASSQLAPARPKGQQGCSCQLHLAAPAAVDLVPARTRQGALGSEPDAAAAKPSDSQAKRSLPWVGRRPSRLGRPGAHPGAKKKRQRIGVGTLAPPGPECGHHEVAARLRRAQGTRTSGAGLLAARGRGVPHLWSSSPPVLPRAQGPRKAPARRFGTSDLGPEAATPPKPFGNKLTHSGASPRKSKSDCIGGVRGQMICKYSTISVT
eukprot:COSAG06_NODE_15614_length_1058_cov_1.229406_1_plen_237_part_00